MVKIKENPIRMDDLGGKPTIFGNTQMESEFTNLNFYPGPWNEEQAKAPENGWLEEEPASFWGPQGLFSGANLLLVFGEGNIHLSNEKKP